MCVRERERERERERKRDTGGDREGRGCLGCWSETARYCAVLFRSSSGVHTQRDNDNDTQMLKC